MKFLNQNTGKSFKSQNIQVLESFSLSPTLRIHLIRIKDIVYVIAENAHTVEVITTLDPSEISIENRNASLFNDILKNKWNKVMRDKKTDSEEK